MFSDMWEFTIPFPNQHQVIATCQNTRKHRTWPYVLLLLHPNHIYNTNYRLVGIIKFDEEYSINLLQQNNSPTANWQILIKDPNLWIRDFKSNMRQNINNENWEEINDGAFLINK
jgi:hypothetical protein